MANDLQAPQQDASQIETPTGAAPTGQPQAAQPQPTQGAQATQPTAQPSPQDFHQGLFKNIFETLAGGPKYKMQNELDAAGNPTGKQTAVRLPQSKKALSASILAGALSGMMAGMASPTKFDQFGHQDLSGAAAGGQQAGQAIAAKKGIAGAKAVSDEEESRRLGTLQHNLALHTAVINNQKLQGEVFDKAIDDAKPLSEAMESAAQGTPGIIVKRGVTEAELQKMMSDPNGPHVTRDSVLPDGKVEIFDKDGKSTGQYSYTYTIYDPNALIKVTDELKKTDPRFAAISTGQSVPARVFAGAILRSSQSRAAQGFIDQWADKTKDLTGKSSKIDLNKEAKNDPYIAKLIPILGKYAGLDPDQVLDGMEKDGVDPNVIGRFQQLLGIDREAWVTQRETAKKKADAANNPDKQPVSQDVVASFGSNLRAQNPNLSDGQIQSLTQEFGQDPTQGNRKQILDRAMKYNEQAKKDADQAGAEFNPKNDEFDENGVNVGQLQTLPEGTRNSVKSVGEGRAPLPAGYGRTKPGLAFAAAVNTVYPNFNVNKVDGFQKISKDITAGGPTGQNINAIRTVLQHLERIHNNTSMWSMWAPSQLSSKAKEFDDDVEAITSELSKAYKGVGAITETEQARFKSALKAWRPGVAKASQQEFLELLDGKVNAIEEAWKDARPSSVIPDKYGVYDTKAAERFKTITGHYPESYEPGARLGSQWLNNTDSSANPTQQQQNATPPPGLSFNRPGQQ